jgi:hypothetical protein
MTETTNARNIISGSSLASNNIRECHFSDHTTPTKKSFYQCNHNNDKFTIKKLIFTTKNIDVQYNNAAISLRVDVVDACIEATNSILSSNDLFYYSLTDNPQDCSLLESSGREMIRYFELACELCVDTLIIYDDCRV